MKWPTFFVEETVVREGGESAVFDCGETALQPLTLTLGITHAVEQESIEVTVYDSEDGARWRPVPLLQFTPKYYCGTYQTSIPSTHQRYLKAMWRVERWGGAGARPHFGIYLTCEVVGAQALTYAAG